MPLDAADQAPEPFRLNPKQAEARQLANGTAMCLLFVGGSRSGKTFFAVRQVVIRALKAPGSRHLIVRKAAVDCKASIGSDTLPKVVALCYPEIGYTYTKQEGVVRLENGSEIWLAGLDSHNLEKILGMEFTSIMVNEASQIPFATFETLKTRLAQKVREVDGKEQRLRFYVDLNPTTRAHWTYRLWIDGVHPEEGTPLDLSDYGHIFMNPLDNRENLPQSYLDSLANLSPRMRKRFFEGLYVADLEEALWRRSLILRTQRDVKDLKRVVVSIDPAASNQPGSNETGITAMGLDDDGLGYLLADESGKMRPEEWASRSLALWRDFDADCIVAEKNQGGDMIESVIRAQQARFIPQGRPQPRIVLVNAWKGKHLRAEPVAGLYERQKIYHVGEFPELEDQMCAFTIDFDRDEEGYSPDRLDSMVHGFTALFGDLVKRKPRRDATPHRPPASAGSWMGA